MTRHVHGIPLTPQRVIAAYDNLAAEQEKVEQLFQAAENGDGTYHAADTASFDLNEKYADLLHLAIDCLRELEDTS